MNTQHTKEKRRKNENSSIKTFKAAGKKKPFGWSNCTQIYHRECKQKASNWEMEWHFRSTHGIKLGMKSLWKIVKVDFLRDQNGSHLSQISADILYWMEHFSDVSNSKDINNQNMFKRSMRKWVIEYKWHCYRNFYYLSTQWDILLLKINNIEFLSNWFYANN